MSRAGDIWHRRHSEVSNYRERSERRRARRGVAAPLDAPVAVRRASSLIKTSVSLTARRVECYHYGRSEITESRPQKSQHAFRRGGRPRRSRNLAPPETLS